MKGALAEYIGDREFGGRDDLCRIERCDARVRKNLKVELKYEYIEITDLRLWCGRK